MKSKIQYYFNNRVTRINEDAGNRLTKTTPQESWTLTYDDIYRLTIPSRIHRLTLLAASSASSTYYQYACGASFLPSRYPSNATWYIAAPTGSIHQTATYGYDEVGNRIASNEPNPPSAGETTTYTYDHENRLTGVTTTIGSSTRQLTFAYDPFGRRIAKTIVQDTIGTLCASPNVCPRTTQYVYDGESILLEYNASGVQTRYTHGPSIDEPLAVEIKSGETFIPYYYHSDGLGSITTLSNTSGAIVQRYEYDAFGNTTVTLQGNIPQPYAFTGREWDTETGMYFYRARYYDPAVGRFVTKDPIGFAGGDVNLYAYVLNNPVNYLDMYGLETEIGVRDFYPVPVPYAWHCFVRFNKDNKDTFTSVQNK